MLGGGLAVRLRLRLLLCGLVTLAQQLLIVPQQRQGHDDTQGDVYPYGGGRQQEIGRHDDGDGAHVVGIGRLQQEGPYLKAVGAGGHVGVAGYARLVGVLPVFVVAVELVLVVHAVLQLIVEGGEAEGKLAAVAGQLHLLALGHVVVVGGGEAGRLQLVVEPEVGDAQAQQRARRVGELAAVNDVVSVHGAEEDVAVGGGDGGTLGEHGVIDTV